MEKAKIRIGLAPTRRSIFSAPDAIKFANLTRDKLDELGIEYVDIKDINEEGLLYDDEDRIKIAEKFKREKVDGLFIPHGNFGASHFPDGFTKCRKIFCFRYLKRNPQQLRIFKIFLMIWFGLYQNTLYFKRKFTIPL